MKTSNIEFLVSVHDVMPETLDKVTLIVRELEDANLAPVTLLVVPGRNWSMSNLNVLRDFVERGHELAGHGWWHKVAEFRNLKHRVHGLLLSKNVAEHLALSSNAIEELIGRCLNWFEINDFPKPLLYVPPAWAMGSIQQTQLKHCGFRYFEFLTGIYDSSTNKFTRIPLLGFEATSRVRGAILGFSNSLNLVIARSTQLARLSIHPMDFDLYLNHDLKSYLKKELHTTNLESFA